MLHEIFDTIAAIATPVGGGVGVVRVSGPESMDIAAGLFRRARRDGTLGGCGLPESHRMQLGWIVDPVSDMRVDQVLLVTMRAPRSYTGEDVVEVQCHGGSAVMRRTLDLVLARGARMAEPGEFTRRAFTNGRMDLSRAESVLEMVEAKSDAALAGASWRLRGSVADRVGELESAALGILAEVEADIDFGAEVHEVDLRELGLRIREQLMEPAENFMAASRDAEAAEQEVSLVMAGRPNVGKSCLANALARQEASIVSPIPGTTRDLVRTRTLVAGVPVSICDTAGVRRVGVDDVEEEGVRRAAEAVRHAAVVILVYDASAGFCQGDAAILDGLAGRPVVLAANKVDLLPGDASRPCPPSDVRFVPVSALNGSGVGVLRQVIGDILVSASETGEECAGAANARQRRAMEQAVKCFARAAGECAGARRSELVAVELGQGLGFLGRITGKTADPDVLDEIFSRFCVGK
ncbi:MAG: tRNA uridine-5-carboxymethylaminomethyl(34) synthesis GTPase MnmE [Desulfatibacillaceae bacterium]